MFTLIAEDKH